MGVTKPCHLGEREKMATFLGFGEASKLAFVLSLSIFLFWL